jgi:hypothetical protein
MRPALVEFGERVRQMERPVGREIDDGSDFFCFVVTCNGHGPDRNLARDGVRLQTKQARRTARTGARSPIVARYSPRRSRFATSPLPSPWNGGRPPRRSL